MSRSTILNQASSCAVADATGTVLQENVQYQTSSGSGRMQSSHQPPPGEADDFIAYYPKLKVPGMAQSPVAQLHLRLQAELLASFDHQGPSGCMWLDRCMTTTVILPLLNLSDWG